MYTGSMRLVSKARGALRASLNPVVRTLFPFGAERTVMRGPLRGYKYVVAPGMGATYAFGHEAYGGEVWSRRIRAGMVVYDIGANCGQMSLMFARLVGERGRVLSFEPAPPQYELLERNVALNHLDARVRPQRLALAAAAGRAQFLCDENAPTQGKLTHVEPSYRPGNPRTIDVETVSLDDLIARSDERPPDVLKIDVEGAGAEVLRGARHTLATTAPAVYIELHGPEEQAGVRDYLQGAGYRLFREDGSEVFDVVNHWESSLWCTSPERVPANG
jgi:FkbM family methyltransferase